MLTCRGQGDAEESVKRRSAVRREGTKESEGLCKLSEQYIKKEGVINGSNAVNR